MKRNIPLAAALIAALITVGAFAAGQKDTGGTAGPAGAGAPVEIVFSNFQGSGEVSVHLDAMVEEFERQNPDIKIKLETVGYNDYFTQLQTRIAGGKAPDCFDLNYENFVSYAKKGVLLDLKPYIDSTGFDVTALDERALAAFSADGIQYGLPASFSTVLLFYNKDLFDRAGVSYPTADWTWKEEQAAAEKIRALGDRYWGLIHPVHFWEFYKVTRQNGGALMNEAETRFTMDSPQNRETLSFMVDRIRKSNVMPSDAQMAGAGEWDMFKTGRLGMLVTGIWAFPEFARDCTFAWDVEVEPGMKEKATHFFANGLVISKDTKHPEAAMKWLAFMAASREAAAIRVNAGWELPAITDETVLADYLTKDNPANRKAVFESLKYIVMPPVVEQASEMTDIVNRSLQAAREGTKTPAQALKDAQAELDSKIKL